MSASTFIWKSPKLKARARFILARVAFEPISYPELLSLFKKLGIQETKVEATVKNLVDQNLVQIDSRNLLSVTPSVGMLTDAEAITVVTMMRDFRRLFNEQTGAKYKARPHDYVLLRAARGVFTSQSEFEAKVRQVLARYRKSAAIEHLTAKT
jgi:hypothetical protein